MICNIIGNTYHLVIFDDYYTTCGTSNYLLEPAKPEPTEPSNLALQLIKRATNVEIQRTETRKANRPFPSSGKWWEAR